LSYDSLLEPISSSQIIPLINFISAYHDINIISFEKKLNLKTSIIFKNKSTKWIRIKNYSLIIIKIIQLIKLIIIIFKNYNKNNVIICRSYVAIWIGLIIKLFTKNKIIADIRGFWLDEKFETKKISKFLYIILKFFEQYIFIKSDYIITLSNKSELYLKKKYNINKNKISTIYTFANKIFNKKKKYKKKINFGYIGNLGSHYEFNKVLKFFEIYDKINPNWKLTVINNYNQKIDSKNIKFDRKKIILKKSKFKRMSENYSKFNVIIYFLKKSFSKIASCPTKFSEIIASNTYLISNSMIGDINILKNKLPEQIHIINKIKFNNILRLNDKIKKRFTSKIKKKSTLIFLNFFEEKQALNKYLNIINKL
jgi:hypothetical protein